MSAYNGEAYIASKIKSIRENAFIELTHNSKITNSTNDKLFSRDIFTNLRFHEGRLYEDALILPYCIQKAKRVTYTAEPLYYYFQSPNSITRGKISKKHYDMIQAEKDRIAFYKRYIPQVA